MPSGLPRVSTRMMERLLLAVALTVPLAIVLAVILQEMRRPQDVTHLDPDAHVADQSGSSTISASELLGTYQGWARKTDGITEVMVLRISRADAAGGFAYTLNVGRYRRDGVGTLGADGLVTLDNLHGRAERFNNVLKMQSSPPDQLPIWQLSSDRAWSGTGDR